MKDIVRSFARSLCAQPLCAMGRLRFPSAVAIRLAVICAASVVFLPCAVLGATRGTSSARRLELPKKALSTARHIAIQYKGRVKPFDSFAREVISHITGASSMEGRDPIVTALSILANKDYWQEAPLISVPFRPLREELGVGTKTSHVSYNELLKTGKLMAMLPEIAAKQRRDEKLSMLENEAMDVYDRFVTLSMLFERDLSLVPPPSAGKRLWLSIMHPEGYPQAEQEALRSAWTRWITSLSDGKPKAIQESTLALASLLRSLNIASYPKDWRVQLELVYNIMAPFRLACWMYLLAMLALLIGLIWNRQSATGVGMAVLWIGFLMHSAGILTRVVIGGRPPVANFYESMLWIPLVAVFIALIFERVYRVSYFGMASGALGAIMLALADNLPLDSSISPVVAVLRSNLWLTIHVLTIVASYGALALAVVLAHIYGLLYLIRKSQSLPTLGLFLYRTMQVGVVLLAGGIMLGAVWANVSWGRYWGWDPKETWSLITLLWFVAVLHGRFAGWLKGAGVAMAAISGFFLLLMTFYGVSFYLVGLHSYAGGSAKPLPGLLIAYLLGELAFMTLIGWAAYRRCRSAA